jgi:hypothetical protein
MAGTPSKKRAHFTEKDDIDLVSLVHADMSILENRKETFWEQVILICTLDLIISKY